MGSGLISGWGTKILHVTWCGKTIFFNAFFKSVPLMTASGIERLLRGFPGGPEVRTPAFPAMTLGSVPGWETNIPHAT